MPRFWKIMAFLGMLCAATASMAAKLPIPRAVDAKALDQATPTKPIQLSKMMVKLSRGEQFGRIKVGLLCVPGESLIWKGGRMQLDTADFDEVFKDELDKLNYNVVSQTRGMFEDGDDHRAEFLIGGTIKSMTVDVCFPHSGLGDVTSSKGAALMEVEWQIYNRLDRQVVEALTTRTGFEQGKMQAGGLEGIIYSAFAENVRALAASGKLLKFVIGAPVDLKVARAPTGAYGRCI